jgi:hypothetical protein
MTKENIIKLYKHFCKLSTGDFEEDNPVKKALIVSDAISNKEELERKFPNIDKATDEETDEE